MRPDAAAGRRLRVAVVGTGSLGRHHARNLGALPDAELVAVVDPDPERGRQAADLGRTRWVATREELPDDLDAVVVAAPTSFHAGIAAWALARKLHCLVEKPMCATLEQARELAALAARTADAGVVLQVGHIERFNPAFDHVDVAALAPRYLRLERVGPHPGRSLDTSVVFDLMIHDLDLAPWLAGMDGGGDVDVESARGGTVVGPLADWAACRLRFANGCVADVVASRASAAPARKILAAAGDRIVEIDLRERTVAKSARVDGSAAAFGTTTAKGSDEEPLRRELSHFLECARAGRTPRASAREGLAAIALADRIEREIGRRDEPRGSR